MAIREEIINAMQDCVSEPINYWELERLARLDNNELVGELIELLHELRDEIDLFRRPKNE